MPLNDHIRLQDTNKVHLIFTSDGLLLHFFWYLLPCKEEQKMHISTFFNEIIHHVNEVPHEWLINRLLSTSVHILQPLYRL